LCCRSIYWQASSHKRLPDHSLVSMRNWSLGKTHLHLKASATFVLFRWLLCLFRHCCVWSFGTNLGILTVHVLYKLHFVKGVAEKQNKLSEWLIISWPAGTSVVSYRVACMHAGKERRQQDDDDSVEICMSSTSLGWHACGLRGRHRKRGDGSQN
jgi:hypothetical protein